MFRPPEPAATIAHASEPSSAPSGETQREVVVLWAAGESTQAIATRLQISVHAVEGVLLAALCDFS